MLQPPLHQHRVLGDYGSSSASSAICRRPLDFPSKAICRKHPCICNSFSPPVSAGYCVAMHCPHQTQVSVSDVHEAATLDEVGGAQAEQASPRHQTDLRYWQPPVGHGLDEPLHRHQTKHRWVPSKAKPIGHGQALEYWMFYMESRFDQASYMQQSLGNAKTSHITESQSWKLFTLNSLEQIIYNSLFLFYFLHAIARKQAAAKLQTNRNFPNDHK